MIEININIFKLSYYYAYSIVLAAIIGFILWLFMYMVNVIVHFLWIGKEGTELPGLLYSTNHTIIFIFLFVMIGSFLASLVFSKMGNLPPKPHHVAKEFDIEGHVDYSKFILIFFGSMIPLFLGASVGPEASLVVFSIYLFDWAVEKTKDLETKLDLKIITHQSEGFAEKVRHNFWYALKIVLWGLVTFGVLIYLSHLDEFPPFFTRLEPINLMPKHILIVIPLIILGFIFGKFYIYSEKVIEKGFSKIKNVHHQTLITGFFIFLSAIFIPWIMLSGEANLSSLIESHQEIGAFSLLVIAILNVLLTHLCINGNMRGGHIFPILFSSFALGLAVSLFGGIDSTLAISAVMMGMTFTLFKSALGLFLLLSLFVPINLLILIMIIILIVKYGIIERNKKHTLEELEEEYEVKS